MSEQNCPSCGAQLRDARTCRHRLDVLLVKTFDVDPSHYALGLGTFVLQHARAFDPVEVAGAHLHLKWALEEGSDLGEITRRLARRFGKDSDKKATLPAIPSEWTYSIDELEDGEGDEERRVVAWARATLADIRAATPQ